MSTTDKSDEFAFTEDNKAVAKLAFDKYSSGGDTLKSKAFITAAAESGLRGLSDDENNDMLQELEDDGGGECDFELFCKIIAKMMEKKHNEMFFKKLFKMLDRRRIGMIPTDDLRLILQAPELQFGPEDVEEMIAFVDDDGSGDVSFEEFYALMAG